MRRPVARVESGKNIIFIFSFFLPISLFSQHFVFMLMLTKRPKLKLFVLFSLILHSTAALKTQPYDLLRWSAAYFRCLSEDEMPPVKPRYEHENVFGCLTRGYLKVLMNQVRLQLLHCVLTVVWSEERSGSCHRISHVEHTARMSALSRLVPPKTHKPERRGGMGNLTKMKKYYKFSFSLIVSCSSGNFHLHTTTQLFTLTLTLL